MIGAPPQRTPLSMESHRSYLSSSQVPAARPSLFHRRNERIDWRRIGKKICKMKRKIRFKN